MDRIEATSEAVELLTHLLTTSIDPSIRERAERVRDRLGEYTFAKNTEGLLEQAQDQYASDEIEIDDDALTSEADEGTWVGAWVWVAKEGSDDEQ